MFLEKNTNEIRDSNEKDFLDLLPRIVHEFRLLVLVTVLVFENFHFSLLVLVLEKIDFPQLEIKTAVSLHKSIYKIRNYFF